MHLTSLIDEAFTFHQKGRLEEAEALYRTALEADSNNFQALQLLGTLALKTGRIGEALALLEHALAILIKRGDAAERHASLYNNLGIALRISGRCREAVEHFQDGLTLDPKLTELYVSLGGAHMELGDRSAAAKNYETALSLNPHLAGCLCDLGTIYADNGRLADAAAMYGRALAADPEHWPSHFNLTQIWRRMERYPEAIALLEKILKKWPGDLAAHGQIGIAYTAAKRYDLAQTHFSFVLTHKPDDPDALHYMANILQTLGDEIAAQRFYRRSHQQRPLLTISAITSPPDFSVLLLFAPGAGNTPLDCLIDHAAYESHVLNLLPDVSYDLDMLRRRADVVVNLIADVDQSRHLLEPAAALIDRIGRPTVNHPRKIIPTDREAVARRLAGTTGCVIPRTFRLAGPLIRSGDFAGQNPSLALPFLLRRAGTHGGVDFEKIHSEGELNAFLARAPSSDYYLTEYIDYRSVDGYFRKYRFIFIGQEIHAYHLAIDDKWKIHHVTTDMANQKWMRDEEEAFLENPQGVFDPGHYDTLHTIRERIGLDYFGIDCALDRRGRIVVFEVNACMLVHQHNQQFPYKAETVRRIKSRFDHMLKNLVQSETGQAEILKNGRSPVTVTR